MLLGPEGRAEACPGAEDTAARLLSRSDDELARTIAAAAGHPDDRSSVLWLLIRGFHLVSHKRQCELVLRFMRGFSNFTAAEQAEAFLAIAPRVRAARQGWRHAKPQLVYLGSETLDQRRTHEEDSVPPFVGALGRSEADHAMVEMMDSMEISLRRLKRSERKRLFRRLDRGVSEGFTPIVFARMLAALPQDQVEALEAWLVDEEALHENAAKQLFTTLLRTAAASSAVGDFSDNITEGADALWAGLAENGADNIRAWLQGERTLTSPRSMAGDLQTSDDLVSLSRGGSDDLVSVSRAGSESSRPRLAVVTKKILMARRHAAEMEKRGVVNATPDQRHDEDVRNQSAVKSLPKRSSCQLHCPPSAFLWNDAQCSAPRIVSKVGGNGRVSLAEQFGL